MAHSSAAVQTAPEIKQLVVGMSEGETHRRVNVGQEGMTLRQAIAVSPHHLAWRQVGDRRVIVDRGGASLTIHFQRRLKRRWVVDEDCGGVRYLVGVLRDGVGRYLSLYPSDDLSDIERIRTLLPLCFQALLVPTSEDWYALERGEL